MTDKSYALITGGAGFIGVNLAHRLIENGRRVLLFDNLSRDGVEYNLRRLMEIHTDRASIQVDDVRDAGALKRAVAGAAQVFHLAAQVAVTTSLTDPVEDFEINARGTLNVLEGIRACATPPPLVFTSTNKVYGGLEDVSLRRCATRYEPEDDALRDVGISEGRNLDFHSPYGCSKGTADQYVRDYARSYGIPTVVFRMSCIYGPHQCGNEDQGWVAHFVRCALENTPITLYGDGRQVRDILFVEDLIDALLLAQARMGDISGQAFNIGGGPGNTTSLIELIERISDLHGEKPTLRFDAWRTGDQRYYVSDTRRFSQAIGWRAQVGIREGIRRLYDWLRAVREREAEMPAERSGAKSGAILAGAGRS